MKKWNRLLPVVIFVPANRILKSLIMETNIAQLEVLLMTGTTLTSEIYAQR